jgi:hypothetical protein
MPLEAGQPRGQPSPRLSPPIGRKRHPAQSVNYPPPRPSNGLVCLRGAPVNHAATGEVGYSAVDGLARPCWGLTATSPEILSIPTYEIRRAPATALRKDG